jgi:hypothetical protein
METCSPATGPTALILDGGLEAPIGARSRILSVFESNLARLVRKFEGLINHQKRPPTAIRFQFPPPGCNFERLSVDLSRF